MLKGVGVDVYKPIVGAFNKAAIDSVFGTRVNNYGCSGASEVAGRIKYDNIISKKDEPGGSRGLKNTAKQKANLLKLVSEQVLAHPLKATSSEADCNLLFWKLGHC
jgi:hypothetical protein